MDAHRPEVTLMLMPHEKQIYPLSTFAFTVSQSSEKSLEKNLGAIIIWDDGVVKRIKSIKKLGLYGTGFFAKLKSALFGVFEIQVELEKVESTFSETSQLIQDYIIHDAKSHDPSFALVDSPEVTLEKIKSLDSVKAIFNYLKMPGPEDCLDVL